MSTHVDMYPLLIIFSKECFCGDEDPQPDLILRNNDECVKQCGGDSNIMCGGGWRTSIYRTGLTGTKLLVQKRAIFHLRSSFNGIFDLQTSIQNIITKDVSSIIMASY